MPNEDWKDVPDYGAMKPPYDGETYVVQTAGGSEFEARYDDPETPENGSQDLILSSGSWLRIDGQLMPKSDPVKRWKPRLINGPPSTTRP